MVSKSVRQWKSTAIVVLLGAAACNANPPAQATGTSTSPPVAPELREVVSGPVAFHNWTAAGSVIYAIETSDGQQWLTFDPATGETASWLGPGPSEAVLQSLGAGGDTQLQELVVSPSGDHILYERLPEGYIEPDPTTPSPDPFPPFELWVARGDGSEQTRVASRFASRCGMLADRATWLREETMIVGACEPYLGLPAFFLADLPAGEFDVLIFTDPASGQQVQPGQAAVSGDGNWLAFVDIPRTNLWLLPLEGLRAAMAGPLDPANRLPVDGVILSPAWGPNSEWIYYWHSPPFGPDTDACDVTLRRVNLAGETNEVLSRASLVSSLGLNEYASLTRCGSEPDWRISPDGMQLLLRILDTVSTDPRLLLLTLPSGG